MTDPLRPETMDVPVRGGTLRCGRWGDGPVVLAAHGITANHMSWTALAAELGDGVTLVAPDLRGRGGSASVPGPFGMASHADDLVAVCDHLGAERAVVVGHSMGAFVATVTATRHPHRVSGLVLVDGGIALMDVPPPDADIDALLEQLIGPSLERLRSTYPSREAYREFWKAHPSLAGAWNEYAEGYVDYDLGAGTEPELRSSCSLEAVREDSRDTLLNADVHRAIRKISCPAVLLRAPRGVLNQPEGLYADEVAEGYASEVPNLTQELVEGTNHFTILLGPRGAARVADRIREAAGV